MKKVKYILLTVIMLVMMTATVYAEPSNDDIPTGLLDLKGDVPEDLKGTIEFLIHNKTIDKEIGISLSYYNGYEGMVFAEFGDYELVEGSSKFMNTNRDILDCTISVEPFNVGDENPNGNWTYKVIVKVTPNSDNVNDTAKSEIEQAVVDYITGGSNNNKNESNSSNSSSDGNTLTIPADNAYFPNMTLTEIKKWYIEEVNKFIATGKTNKNGRIYDLEYFQQSLKRWATDVYDKDETGMIIEHYVVEGYDTEETQEFYQSINKIYEFVREYEEQNNVYLNFENWDKVNELETSTESSTTTNNNKEEKTSTISNEESTKIETSTTADSGNDNKEEKSIFDTLKGAWLTILIIIVVLIGGIVWKIKYNKSEE